MYTLFTLKNVLLFFLRLMRPQIEILTWDTTKVLT